MRIGIDASLARTESTGTGRYARGLLRALLAHDTDNEYVFYFRRGDAGANPFFALARPGLRARLTDAPSTLLRIHANLPLALRRDSVDVYHSLGYFLPVLWHGRAVVTIHDIHPILFRQHWWHPGLRGSWLMLRLHIPLAVRQARRIIVPSDYTRQTLCERYRLSPDRVVTTHPGVEPFFLEPAAAEELAAVESWTGGEPFYLHVGALVPLKNVAGAVRALARVRARRGAGRLLVTGTRRGSPYARQLDMLVEQHGLRDAVVFVGQVSDVRLRALYTRALALVAPSFGEGFGLPVLEAMACGTPIIASNTTALPEVTGGTALAVDPHDVDSVSEAMERVAADAGLRRDLGARGRGRAAQFTWERAAAAVLQAYRES